MATHTILLVQLTRSKSTRTFTDHENVTQALEAIINMYENRLKQAHPFEEHVQYSVRDLYTFMDGVGEMCALVFNPAIMAYVPHDKDWLKTKIYNYLLDMSK